MALEFTVKVADRVDVLDETGWIGPGIKREADAWQIKAWFLLLGGWSANSGASLR